MKSPMPERLVFFTKLEMLLENGLIKGGDLNNAIVYVDKNYPKRPCKNLSKAFKKDKIAVKPNGILDNLNTSIGPMRQQDINC